jgi:leucyl aminopeptidase
VPTPLPTLDVTSRDGLELDVDVLVVGVYRGGFEAPGAAPALEALGLPEVPRDAGFRGRLGEVRELAAPGMPFRRLVLVGLGRMDETTPATLRRAAGAASAAVATTATSLATTLVLANPVAASVRAVAEGAALGAYRFTEARSQPQATTLTSVTVVVPSSVLEGAAVEVGRAGVAARATALARDLVNRPPHAKGPQDVCDWAAEVVGDDVEVEVWDEAELERRGCGGTLAVGRGSARPPRMLLLRHRPENPVARVALVGKGIVFDSGGLSLKTPYTNMVTMKSDLGGAAAVIGVMSALAALDVRVEVLGIAALAENMPDGDAQRPGDVLTTFDGTTVEVLNTDAEGRLVLADALGYAASEEVDAIVDVATLTGAALVAVGGRASAAYANDDDLLRQVLAAAEGAGEPTWHLPLWDELRDNLESEVADLNNLGRGDSGGSIMAGLFLREFVDTTPWVHLDVAGAAWADVARGHVTKGGTGMPVGTLLRWLEASRG